MPNTTSYPELHGWKAREVRYLVPVCKALANNVQPSRHGLRCHGCAPVALVCRIIPGWQSMLHTTGGYNGASSPNTISWHICLIWQRIWLPGLPGLTLVSRWWVRTITSLASACTANTSARQLTKTFMAKYRIAMHLRHCMNLCQS